MSLTSPQEDTLNDLYIDFDFAKHNKDYEKAREIIKAIREYIGAEADRLETELFQEAV